MTKPNNPASVSVSAWTFLFIFMFLLVVFVSVGFCLSMQSLRSVVAFWNSFCYVLSALFLLVSVSADGLLGLIMTAAARTSQRYSPHWTPRPQSPLTGCDVVSWYNT
jgi:hypothetical protein